MREAKDTKGKDLMNALSARCRFGTSAGFPDHLLEPCSRTLPESSKPLRKKTRGTQKLVTPAPIRTGNIDPPVPEQIVAHFSPPWGLALNMCGSHSNF